MQLYRSQIMMAKEPKRNDQEIKQRAEWLKHKGVDHIDAMQLYIDKVKELAQIYEPRPDEDVAEEIKNDNK